MFGSFDSSGGSSHYEEEEYDVEAKLHSTFTMQSGRVDVGNHEEDAESMRVSVEYDQAFSEDGPLPMVFVQAEGELGMTYGDVFGCTVVEQRHDGFEVNVGRHGETKSWGQTVGLNYIAVVAVKHPLVQTVQLSAGSQDDEGSVTVDYRFPMPIPKGCAPFVMATCVGDDYPDAFSVTLKALTRHKCRFAIARLRCPGEGWGQDVRLNVCCFNQGLFPCVRVPIGNSGDNCMVVEDVQWPIALRRRPLPFAMAMHPPDADPNYGDSFVVTVANVMTRSCQLNVGRGDSDGGWGMELRAVIALIP